MAPRFAMPPLSPSSLRRSLAQAAIPAAVLLLLVLVAGLTYNARRNEQRHRATAEQALRDYAAFAAWEFSRQAADMVRDAARSSVHRVREVRLAAGAPLPDASLLTPDSASCGCGLTGFRKDAVAAFRVVLGEGAVDTDRAVGAPVRAAIARQLSALRDAAAAGMGLPARAGRRDPAREEWARLLVDTIAGQPHVIAFAVLRDRTGSARAAYGLVSRPTHVAMLSHCVAEETERPPLLPPSLTGGAPNDSVLHLRLEYPAAYPGAAHAYALGAPTAGLHAAADTMPAALGGFVTVVELRPALAATLLIGGMPQTQLPWLVALLGLASALSAVALAQLRRSRELTRLRSQFVANVSHELRTPLAQISMFSETLMLARERSGEERQHFLTVIHREARRLTSLVDGVLRFSRGEAGMTRLRPEARDVAADVRETVLAFQPLADGARTTVQVRAAGDAWALADGGALRQVLLNLLDNAVKYGPRGQTVTVEVAPVEASGHGVVRVRVLDQGVGIPAADRERIFEPFARLERAGLPRVSGSGIGLSVVRELVTAQGGRVWVEDGPADATGACVAFTLPALAAPAAAPATPPWAPAAEGALVGAD